MALTPAQIAQYAASAGFTGNALTISVAVALAESGGNPTVVNQIGAVGLWQILVSAHPQYTTAWLQNPANNAAAAYAISSGGSNWNPWQTYTNGSYKQFMAVAQNVTGVTSVKPWYTYSRIDNFGQIDPQGNYWKPDSNILTPPGYPVTALLPGTVTSVARTSWGQTVVTIRLNTALNSLATHIYYEHMHDATVRMGQTVFAGQLIGHANYSGEGAALGFGLYPGDVFGSNGSNHAWDILQNDLKPGGAGLLNPVGLLNLASQGKLSIPTGVTSGGGTIGGFTLSFSQGITPTYTKLSSMVHNTLIDTPGFYGIALALDEQEQFPGWVDLTTPQSVGVGPTQIPIPDVIGEVRSIGATISDNFIPFAIRSSLVICGLILCIALLIKAAEGPVKAVAPLVAAAA